MRISDWSSDVCSSDLRISSSTDSQVFDRSGQKIPGVQPQTINARIAYDQPTGALQGFGAYVELNARDGYWLDNANLLKAPGYGLVNLNLHYDAPSSTRGRSAISFYLDRKSTRLNSSH